MSYDIEYNDMAYDTGYGEQHGDLIIEVTPIFTDERFDAYNGAGVLQLYGNRNELTDIEFEGATLFLVGNNGEELGEITFDSLEELTELYAITKDDLIDNLINRGVTHED